MNWSIQKAKEFCLGVTDGTHDSPKAVDVGRYLITSKHLGEYEIDFCSAKMISEDDYKKVIARSKVGQWDILFSMIGTIGNCYLEKNKSVKYACKNMGIFQMGGDEEKAYWLYYYLKSPQAKRYVLSHLRGSTQQYIPLGSLREFPIPIPEKGNRIKIIDILKSIDGKIETNNRINENLLQQLFEIYHSWYVDFSIASKGYISSEYGDIPIGWHYKQLGDVCQSVSVTHKFDKEQLIFLNTGDVANGQFLHSNYMPVSDMPGQAKKTICPDDILYSEIRPANRHFAYVNFPSEDYVVSTKLMVIRPKGIDSRRLYHFLTMKETLTELQLQAESRSGTFPQIRFDNVSRLPIIIADAETENTFTGILHSVYRQIDSNIAENNKLAQIRDSLLPKFMSGELDVSELDL